MGISTNFYTIYGFGIDEVDEDFMEAHDEANTDIFVLFDVMGGDYTIFGIKLFDSGDMRWGFEGGDQYVDTGIESLPDKKERYKNRFCEVFPKYKHYMEGRTWTIISMVHIS